MASTRSGGTSVPGSTGAKGPVRASAAEALQFLDPKLARMRWGVEMVRVLLDESYDTQPIVLERDEERVLFERAVSHRLHPQLKAAIDSSRIVVSPRLAEALDEANMSLATRRLSLEGLVVHVSETLSGGGIEALILKGIATGRLDHPDPARRHTTDVDILVRPGDFERAIEALADAGFTHRNVFNLLDKGQSWASAAGVVDVHTRPHAAGRPLSERWWTSAESFLVAGREIKSLARGGRLAHAASHFSVSYPSNRTLSSLLDLLVIGRAASSSDRATAEEFLAEVGVSDITSRITGRAAVLVGDRAVALGRRGHRPLDIVLRRAYDRPDLDLVSIKLAKTFGMPWREKPRAIRTLVVPEGSFLEEGGYTSQVDRLRTLIRRRWIRSKSG